MDSSLRSPHSIRSPLPAWKRVIDLGCCLVALPPFLVVAFALRVLLWFTSPGPLFFRQDRIGYKGRTFRLYKFRTMHLNADTAVHHAHVTALLRANVPMHKMDAAGDRRLVPFGWLIRATGIDELPQILNVLRGDMSIVGPRPCIPYEYEQYTDYHRRRLDACPGLTGLWQVSGKNRTTFEEMVALDIDYARRKSPGLDLAIIARTVPALCTQVRDTRRRATRRGPARRPDEVASNATPTFQT